jgi:hypothetical protein
VRVGILVDDFSSPLTAEITAASAARMGLGEGQGIYATFKATEARAYMWNSHPSLPGLSGSTAKKPGNLSRL